MQRCSEDRELNQAGSKSNPVDQPVRTDRTIVDTMYGTSDWSKYPVKHHY